MTNPTTETVVLNGELLPVDRACVSIDDRGWLFGDGAYEVVRLYRGVPFRLGRHLRRLRQSCDGLGIPWPTEREHALPGLIDDLVARNGIAEGECYIHITRGVAPRDLPRAEVGAPTELLRVYPLRAGVGAAWETGLTVVFHPEIRWARCHLKSLNLLANVLAREEAQRQGAHEALFVQDRPADAGGPAVTEGTGSTVFAVKDGTLTTSPLSNILPGVTREVVFELAGALGIPIREDFRSPEFYRDADEVFLTSTTKEVAPVTRLEGQRIGDGWPGPVSRRLHEAFQKLLARELGSDSPPRPA